MPPNQDVLTCFIQQSTMVMMQLSKIFYCIATIAVSCAEI